MSKRGNWSLTDCFSEAPVHAGVANASGVAVMAENKQVVRGAGDSIALLAAMTKKAEKTC